MASLARCARRRYSVTSRLLPTSKTYLFSEISVYLGALCDKGLRNRLH